MNNIPIKEIYLDNCATTKVCTPAINSCVKTMSDDFGNPSSLHKKGFEAEKIITNAKKIIASNLNCSDKELFFTSGATESNNIAIVGYALANKRYGNKIVICAIEHHSVIACAKHLEKLGFSVVEILPNELGEFSPLDFFNAVDENTLLVSCMFVNNEVGTILPIMEIAKAVKRKNPNTAFHVDAVQGFMKLTLKLKNSPIDLLSASGHKIYAPKGVGFIFIKKGVRISPIIQGGSQENGIRSGTQATPLIAALSSSVQMLSDNLNDNLLHYKKLKIYMLSKISSSFEPDEVFINSPANSVDYIINISVKGIRSEVMLHFLEQYNIFVSSGSACSKGQKSHVLLAMNLDSKRIDSALRISFSMDTSTNDIDELIDKILLASNTLIKVK